MSFASEVKMPEVYYDICSRVIPGACFIISLRYYIFHSTEQVNIIDLIILVCLSYIIGFITNPIASRFCALLENYAMKTHKTDAYTKEKDKTKHITIFDKNTAIIDKMHAEITGFIQLSVFNLIFWIVLIISNEYLFWRTSSIMLVLFLYFFWCAREFARRRYSRIVTITSTIHKSE